MSGIFELASSGSPIILVLLLLSLVTVALIITKTMQLRGVRSGATGRIEALKSWANGDKQAAIDTVKGQKAPADRILAFALSSALTKMQRKPLEAELMRRGNAEVEEMGRSIRILELVAMISPLLGLLGTVMGMIQSFQELELAQGAANASVLAGGIWQALLTTAAGLIVAIPAAVAASLLSARVDGAAHDIESAVGQFFLIEDTGTTAIEA